MAECSSDLFVSVSEKVFASDLNESRGTVDIELSGTKKSLSSGVIFAPAGVRQVRYAQ